MSDIASDKSHASFLKQPLISAPTGLMSNIQFTVFSKPVGQLPAEQP
jgi:hypothetical protein